MPPPNPNFILFCEAGFAALKFVKNFELTYEEWVVAYNDDPIIYDAIGNPTECYNGWKTMPVPEAARRTRQIWENA